MTLDAFRAVMLPWPAGLPYAGSLDQRAAAVLQDAQNVAGAVAVLFPSLVDLLTDIEVPAGEVRAVLSAQAAALHERVDEAWRAGLEAVAR